MYMRVWQECLSLKALPLRCMSVWSIFACALPLFSRLSGSRGKKSSEEKGLLLWNSEKRILDRVIGWCCRCCCFFFVRLFYIEVISEIMATTGGGESQVVAVKGRTACDGGLDGA